MYNLLTLQLQCQANVKRAHAQVWAVFWEQQGCALRTNQTVKSSPDVHVVFSCTGKFA